MQLLRSRVILRIFGALLVLGAGLLFWFGRPRPLNNAVAQGEEVYASHDCTDCHLSTAVLAQKRQKKEWGLIRVRKNENDLVSFLRTDARHSSFGMISAEDRKALLDYLRTLVPTQ